MSEKVKWEFDTPLCVDDRNILDRDGIYLWSCSSGTEAVAVAAVINSFRDNQQALAEANKRIAELEAKIAKCRAACKMTLEYLPAKDGRRTLEPDGDAQLLICNCLRDVLAEGQVQP